MICDEAQKKVDELVDGSLVGRQREEFERHLLRCPECRSYLEWVRWLSAAARALPGMDPSRDLWPEVSRELAASGRSPRGSFADHKPVRLRLSHPLPDVRPASGIRPGLARAAVLFFLLLALSLSLLLISREIRSRDRMECKLAAGGGVQGWEQFQGSSSCRSIHGNRQPVHGSH